MKREAKTSWWTLKIKRVKRLFKTCKKTRHAIKDKQRERKEWKTEMKKWQREEISANGQTDRKVERVPDRLKPGRCLRLRKCVRVIKGKEKCNYFCREEKRKKPKLKCFHQRDYARSTLQANFFWSNLLCKCGQKKFCFAVFKGPHLH